MDIIIHPLIPPTEALSSGGTVERTCAYKSFLLACLFAYEPSQLRHQQVLYAFRRHQCREGRNLMAEIYELWHVE